MPKFPDPDYFYDTISGTIYKEDSRHTLAVGDLALPGEALARGTFALRYAVPTLNPPVRWLVPGLLAGERGGAFVGRKAWDYMQDRWEHHPRADVIGIDPAGEKQTYFLKELDLAARVRVYAYPDPAATTPLCIVDALAAPDDAELPELVARYMRRSPG
jgi:hypothetical protein